MTRQAALSAFLVLTIAACARRLPEYRIDPKDTHAADYEDIQELVVRVASKGVETAFIGVGFVEPWDIPQVVTDPPEHFFSRLGTQSRIRRWSDCSEVASMVTGFEGETFLREIRTGGSCAHLRVWLVWDGVDRALVMTVLQAGERDPKWWVAERRSGRWEVQRTHPPKGRSLKEKG